MIYLVFRLGQQELGAQLEANARAFAERIERDPDGRFATFRAARAEHELTGNYTPVAQFVRRLKAGAFDRRSTFLEIDR
jgi:hypothetical protein